MEQLVEQITCSFWYAADFDIRINGNSKNRLFLKLRSPILSIASVEICGVELDPSWYAFDEDSIYWDCEGSGGVIGDPELMYRLSQVEDEGLFPRGYNNIHVVGTYGTAVVPEWIKQIVIILVRNHEDPTLYKHKYESEKIGDYSYKRAKGEIDYYYTGIVEADFLLHQYINREPMLGVP